jgi:hypothetical protein
MLGLVVYGILNRQCSLRELEGLARRYVGAWWVCGGHQPDHSPIGKFIQLHAAVLTEEFFVALVKRLITKLRLGPGTVAGDGTVIEAAASHYRALRTEAVIEAARRAQAVAEVEPTAAHFRKAAAAKRAAVDHSPIFRRARSVDRKQHSLAPMLFDIDQCRFPFLTRRGPWLMLHRGEGAIKDQSR